MFHEPQTSAADANSGSPTGLQKCTGGPSSSTITVSWTDSDVDDPRRWALSIQDTGPGLTGEATPLTDALEEATDSARSAPSPNPGRLPPTSTGEGIGLSIVKRLAELLDASLEVHTDAAVGTTFRVLFPRRYDA